MQVAVWDTWVTKKEGGEMHFDILVPAELKDPAQIFAYGETYLHEKGQSGQPISTQECKFCHIETADEITQSILAEKGYRILEMQGC